MAFGPFYVGGSGSAINSVPVAVTSNDGVTYTATVKGVKALSTGLTLTIIPDRESTTAEIGLNINGLGVQPVGVLTGSDTGTTVLPRNNNWLAAGKPVQIQYNGTCWVAALPQPDAGAMTGKLDISHGGTGAASAEEARASLGLGAVATLGTLYVAGTTAPTDTKVLWIDTTANTGGLKYYNGTAWVHVPVAYT